MLDEPLAQELDDRLLAEMPERDLIILSLRQNNKEHKAMYEKLREATKLRNEVGGLKNELKWMWRVVIVGLLAVIFQVVKQTLFGK